MLVLIARASYLPAFEFDIADLESRCALASDSANRLKELESPAWIGTNLSTCKVGRYRRRRSWPETT